MAKAKLNKTIVVGNNKKLVRFSYVNVNEPHAVAPGQLEKYSVMLLIDKNDKESLAAFKAAMKELTKEACAQGMWGGKVPAKFNNPLHDADEDPNKSALPEYQGMFYVNASSKFKPGVVDRNKQPIIDPSDFYSGCYGRAQINLFPYEHMGNTGIGVGLNNLQKVKDGPDLSGHPDPQAAFDGFDNSAFDDDDDFSAAIAGDDDDDVLPF